MPAGTTAIHPLASVHPEAQLGQGVTVGPFAVIGPRARVGANCAIHGHAHIAGAVLLGPACEVHAFAVIGGPPQHRRYPEGGEVVTGTACVFREYVTVNTGTPLGDGATRLGDSVYLMAGVHVAHDCRIAHGVTIANGSQLAGHVVVEEGAVIAGGVLIAQRVRIGAGAFVAGGARVEASVLPFVIAAGDRARVRAINVEGLRKAGHGPEAIAGYKCAFRIRYRGAPPAAASATARMILGAWEAWLEA